MARRTVERLGGAGLTEGDPDELARHYARILGRQTDRRVSEVIRTCLLRLPQRLPLLPRDRQAIEALIERVLRLGEVGAPDLVGSPRNIDRDIARALGEAPGDPRVVYRALHALCGHTVLVERLSRQIWALRLSGLTDPSSSLHRALLVETPSLYSLPLAVTPPNTGAPVHVGAAPADQGDAEVRAEVERLQREVAGERALRVAADLQRAAAEAELATLRRALEDEGRARDAVVRQLDAEQMRRVEAERQAEAAQCDALVEVNRLEQAITDLRQREAEAVMSLAKTRQELEGLRQAQAQDLARVRELVEQNQIAEAITFFAARVLGAGVDDANRVLDRLPQTPGQPPRQVAIPRAAKPLPYVSSLMAGIAGDEQQGEPRSNRDKVGRNSPCPCGSGKKHKRCCGLASA